MDRRIFLKSTFIAMGAAFSATDLYAQAAGNSLVFMTPNTLTLAFAPELYADVSGKYKKNGVEVRIEVGRGAAQPLQLVAGNQIHIGRTAGSSYMAARALGNSDIISFGTIAQTSPFLLVSSAKAPIRRAEDIAGKIIGLPSFGGTAEGGLNMMLEKANIALSSVQRERVAYNPSTFGLIEAGRLHGFFANTSAVARMRGEKLPIHAIPIDDGIPGNVYVAREANLQKDRASYVAFIRSVVQSTRELSGMNDEGLATALSMIARKYDIPGMEKMDIAIEDIKATRPLWAAHGIEKIVRNDEKQWSSAQRLLEKSGVMKPSSRAMFTNGICEEAAK